MPRVLFYAQYLKGIGHVVRAKRIAEELAKLGADVTLVIGGPVIPDFPVRFDVEVHQLPPLKASATSYSTLLRDNDDLADDTYLAGRRDQLLALYERLRPDVILTEAFPMGRWAMEFELVPLLERATAARPRPLIVASLRDILQVPKHPEKVQLSVSWFKEFYDHMLVHGDRRLLAIEESFPALAPFADQAHYTGIVAPELDQAATAPADTFDVIVTGGGGAIAYDVLAAAISAKPHTALADGSWLALAGHRMHDARFAELRQLSDAHGVHLERFRDDLVHLMRNATLSVQRAGYNTVADLMRCECRAVLVPDSRNQQREQPLRAEKLEALGRAVVVSEEGLTPATLAAGIDRALSTPPKTVALDLNGAANSARIVLDLVRSYKSGQH